MSSCDISFFLKSLYNRKKTTYFHLPDLLWCDREYGILDASHKGLLDILLLAINRYHSVYLSTLTVSILNFVC